MPDMVAIAGSTIAIGGVLAAKATDFVASDFSGQSWTLIDGWETMGALGDTAEVISTALINQGRMVKIKGTNDAGDMECSFVSYPSDPGQLALIAAQKSKSNYAFRVAHSDGVTEYFIGMVGSRQRAGGGANDASKRNFTISVNSNIV